MLRVAISVVLLAACGGGARGLTWPKPSASDTDGGESLAPKRDSPLAANDVSDDDDDITIDTPADKPASTKSDDKPASSETPRAPTAPTVTAPEDVINIDDLVIEIDD